MQPRPRRLTFSPVAPSRAWSMTVSFGQSGVTRVRWSLVASSSPAAGPWMLGARQSARFGGLEVAQPYRWGGGLCRSYPASDDTVGHHCPRSESSSGGPGKPLEGGHRSFLGDGFVGAGRSYRLLPARDGTVAGGRRLGETGQDGV